MNRPIVTINRLVYHAMRSFLVIVLLLVLAPVSHAHEGIIDEGNAVSFELVERDGIMVNSANLTAQHFFKSSMSEVADERRSAKLYLLGVLDATEGKSWCGYQTFHAGTLRERVFEEFEKLDSHRLNERASKVIEDILSQRFPCGRKK